MERIKVNISGSSSITDFGNITNHLFNDKTIDIANSHISVHLPTFIREAKEAIEAKYPCFHITAENMVSNPQLVDAMAENPQLVDKMAENPQLVDIIAQWPMSSMDSDMVSLAIDACLGRDIPQTNYLYWPQSKSATATGFSIVEDDFTNKSYIEFKVQIDNYQNQQYPGVGCGFVFASGQWSVGHGGFDANYSAFYTRYPTNTSSYQDLTWNGYGKGTTIKMIVAPSYAEINGSRKTRSFSQWWQKPVRSSLCGNGVARFYYAKYFNEGGTLIHYYLPVGNDLVIDAITMKVIRANTDGVYSLVKE